MFILRRLDCGFGEVNTMLDEYYILVSKEKNNSEFNETTKLWTEDDLKNIYAVIVYNDGASIMPLYNNSNYYIMTSDGKTFANISNK